MDEHAQIYGHLLHMETVEANAIVLLVVGMMPGNRHVACLLRRLLADLQTNRYVLCGPSS